MSNLVSTGVCPFCDGGHNSPCYAEYIDGYKCFSCGVSKNYDALRSSLLSREAKPQIKSSMYLPPYEKNVRHFSPTVLKWLYKYYVFDNIIKKYQIGYIGDYEERGESIILPVINDGAVSYAVRRYFPNKYVLGIGDKQVYKIKNGGKQVVIVEDYISAIRLAEHMDVYCLFGTYLNKGDIPELLDSYRGIIIWLDGDEAGRRGAQKLLKDINYKIKDNKWRFPIKYPYDWDLRVIETDEDPKAYSDSEIKDFLYASL